MYYKDYLGNIYEPAPRGLETPVGNVRRLDEEPSDIVWEPPLSRWRVVAIGSSRV
jgi:hypothetical protein